MCPLTCPLRANWDQDVIQIDNKETLAMAKEQNRFGEGHKTLGAVASPKAKPSTDKAHNAKQNVRNNNDA